MHLFSKLQPGSWVLSIFFRIPVKSFHVGLCWTFSHLAFDPKFSTLWNVRPRFAQVPLGYRHGFDYVLGAPMKNLNDCGIWWFVYVSVGMWLQLLKIMIGAKLWMPVSNKQKHTCSACIEMVPMESTCTSGSCHNFSQMHPNADSTRACWYVIFWFRFAHNGHTQTHTRTHTHTNIKTTTAQGVGTPEYLMHIHNYGSPMHTHTHLHTLAHMDHTQKRSRIQHIHQKVLELSLQCFEPWSWPCFKRDCHVGSGFQMPFRPQNVYFFYCGGDATSPKKPQMFEIRLW